MRKDEQELATEITEHTEGSGTFLFSVSSVISVENSFAFLVFLCVPLRPLRFLLKPMIVFASVACLVCGADLVPPDPVEHPESTLMLDLPGTGTDPHIDFAALPKVGGRHALVSLGDRQWQFRLHNYLAHHDGQFWCFWSHGPVIEDRAGQHLRYATSRDGLSWSKPQVLAGPPRKGFGYIARGFWLRDGELLALASLFEAPGYSGGHLELVAFRWNGDRSAWQPAGRVFDDALNNFPPKKLPTGEWMMSRRASDRSVSLLIGGTRAIDDWQVVPFSSYRLAGGASPEEPYWWSLPDGNIVGLFRDNSRSGRLLRSFSTDNGRRWTPPVRTNFPDATSKFNVLATSRGYWALVSNPNPKRRNPLCLAASTDGLVFTRMIRLPIPETLPGVEWVENSRHGATAYESLQYPHVIEHGGSLLIAYSRRKQTVEVVTIPLDEIDAVVEGEQKINRRGRGGTQRKPQDRTKKPQRSRGTPRKRSGTSPHSVSSVISVAKLFSLLSIPLRTSASSAVGFLDRHLKVAHSPGQG